MESSWDILIPLSPILITVAAIVALKVWLDKKKTEKLMRKYEAMSFQQRQLEFQKLIANEGRYKTSHVLHFLISFFTFGVWVFVWFLIAQSNSSMRQRIRKMQELVINSQDAA